MNLPFTKTKEAISVNHGFNTIKNYANDFVKHLDTWGKTYEESINRCVQLIKNAKDEHHEVLVFGSGFNTDLAEHANVDWVRFAQIKTTEIGHATLTAYGNDCIENSQLKEYLKHRGFGSKDVIVGINVEEDIDLTLKEAIKYNAQEGGINILITNNTDQICGIEQSEILIHTKDNWLAADLAQTFTHFIAIKLASYYNPTLCSQWTHSFKDYTTFLARALQHESFSNKNIKYITTCIRQALSKGKSLYAFGNGGRATLASYFINNLQNLFKGKPGILRNTINLSSYQHIINNSIKTKRYKKDIYHHLLSLLGATEGDVLVGISTSGNSDNILHPFINFPKVHKIAILGFGDGGLLGALNNEDYTFIVPDDLRHRCHAIAENGQRIALTAILKDLQNRIENE